MTRLRGESGANAVEFALVLPLLVMLVMAMLWGGLALNRQLSITQAAREGARMGATLPYPADITWLDEVESRVRTTVAGQVGTSTDAWVCIRAFDDTGTLLASRATGPSQPSDPACAGSTIADAPTLTKPRVEILIAHPARFDWVFGGATVRVRGEALARHEGSD